MGSRTLRLKTAQVTEDHRSMEYVHDPVFIFQRLLPDPCPDHPAEAGSPVRIGLSFNLRRDVTDHFIRPAICCLCSVHTGKHLRDACIHESIRRIQDLPAVHRTSHADGRRVSGMHALNRRGNHGDQGSCDGTVVRFAEGLQSLSGKLCHGMV